MKIYSIALVIVILSCVIGTINDIGIFNQPLPENPEISSENTEVIWQAVNQSVYEETSWIFWIPMIIVRLAKILFAAITTAITIIPLLYSYGVPMDICVMVNAPIWLVYAAGTIQWITGHPFKGNE